MKELQKFIKNQKSLLNKLYHLYKELPEDLQSIPYTVKTGKDWVSVLWGYKENCAVVTLDVMDGGKTIQIISRKNNMSRYYDDCDLTLALEEAQK